MTAEEDSPDEGPSRAVAEIEEPTLKRRTRSTRTTAKKGLCQIVKFAYRCQFSKCITYIHQPSEIFCILYKCVVFMHYV